ncbi:MAG: hypothetical protein WAU01_17440 [Saprospiraceae bacterium]
MKTISLYYYNGKIFIIPNSVLNNGPKVLSGPPLVLELIEGEIKNGILQTLNHCGYLNEEPEENYFNHFLKLSKAKTNKNLVEKGKLIGISEKDNIFYLTRMSSNLKYKSFESDEKIEFKKTDISEMVEMIVKHLTPITLSN